MVLFVSSDLSFHLDSFSAKMCMHKDVYKYLLLAGSTCVERVASHQPRASCTHLSFCMGNKHIKDAAGGHVGGSIGSSFLSKFL